MPSGEPLAIRHGQETAMRVLFTSQPGYGHFHPLVPVAQALRDAGHEPAFAATPAFTPTVVASGFEAFTAGADDTPDELRQRREQQAKLPGAQWAEVMWTNGFAGTRAENAIPDLIAIARDWQPDLIVRDLTEIGGYITAESLDIPHAEVQVAAFRPQMHRLISPQVNRLRASVGLPPDPDMSTLYRYLMLTYFPPSFQDPGSPLPATMHALRHIGFNSTQSDTLPDWMQDLPERPTVYATLGTVFTYLADIYRAILDALEQEPLNVILTIGKQPALAGFGARPQHIRIEPYIPQSLLLPHCDLVITHGGSGTVKDCLSHGLPMVIIPIGADQYHNAEQCARTGVARIIGPEERTPEAIREAVRLVLSDPAYLRNAQRLREEMEALPGIDHAVGLLEQLGRERAPLTRP
jgi:MGT family glycosyltransferase